MLKEKMNIGNMVIDGRIVMPPMATSKCAEDGLATEELISYYGERAANPNIGMIITEHCYISMQGKAGEGQMSLASDDAIDKVSKVVSEIHKYGTKVVAQLNHAGGSASPNVTGCAPVSASEILTPVRVLRGEREVPKALSSEEIAGIVKDFAAAAKRAKAAGYDGVEIHSAHGYLLNQFYSPLTNQRTDEYGGSLDHRLRFHREVIAAVKKAVGEDYPVAVRLGGCDYMEGGSTIEDSVYASKVFEEAGIDLLDISGGLCFFLREGHDEPGYFQDMTSEIKKAVSIPILLTGGVKTLKDAEELIAKGAADLIGVGRELLKNAKWEMEN